jgi:CheY-like chemotaxis protein
MYSLGVEIRWSEVIPFLEKRFFHLAFLLLLPGLFIYIEYLMVKIKQSQEAREQFIAKMSHEIRTPLNGILGLTEILSMETIKQEHLEYLDLINYSSQNLLSIVNEVLDFSQILKDGIILEKRNFDLAIMLESIVCTFKVRAEAKGINFISVKGEDLPRMIYGDDTKIYQVLGNVLSNAVQFTSDGYVKLETDHDVENKVLTFSITDTGNGISGEKVSDLMNTSTKDKKRFYSSNMGLGLQLINELTDALNGTISVHSERGQGSKFIIKISYDEEQVVVDDDGKVLPDDDEFSENYPYSILVAEDNMVNQSVLKSLLRKIGYEAEYACNGKEVLEALEYKNYDIIFMDIQMPEMSGREATEILRKRSLGGNPYIIALTANAFESDKQSCFDVGMNDFLTKPVSLTSIKLALAKTFENKDVA